MTINFVSGGCRLIAAIARGALASGVNKAQAPLAIKRQDCGICGQGL